MNTAAWMSAAQVDGEIVVVDDGSTDATADILKDIQTEEPRLRCVRHAATRGYGAAVRSGCDAATGDTIVFMDSDGQFDAADTALLLAALSNADIAWGVRGRRADGMVRILSQRLYQTLVRLTVGLRSPDLNSGFKAFPRRHWPLIRPATADGAVFHAELLQRAQAAGLSVRHVTVRHYPRSCGTPTGLHAKVIGRMFRELLAMRRTSTESRGKP